MINNKYLKSAALISLLAGTINTAMAEEKKHALTIEASMFDVEQTWGDADWFGSDDKILPGLGYAYKFTLDNNIFIRPGLVANFSDIEVKDKSYDDYDGSLKVSSIHSYYVDAGSKINDKMSAYATIGITSATIDRTGLPAGKETGRGVTLGLGVAYNVAENIDIDFKYQTTDLEFDVAGFTENYEVSLDAFKLGASFKF
ncbi:MAG: outer membrane protein [Rickettsiales bacterium]